MILCWVSGSTSLQNIFLEKDSLHLTRRFGLDSYHLYSAYHLQETKTKLFVVMKDWWSVSFENYWKLRISIHRLYLIAFRVQRKPILKIQMITRTISSCGTFFKKAYIFFDITLKSFGTTSVGITSSVIALSTLMWKIV